MQSTSFVTSSLITCPHAFSTRLGGVSEGVYASLNLGFARGDREESVRENWRRFGAAAGIAVERIVCARQVHEAEVLAVGREDAAVPGSETPRPAADGFVTRERGVPLVVFTADCAPLLMHDPVAGVAAAVHCGWRSTVADIERVAVEKMCALGAHAADIRAAVGPCIGPCCFETGAEVPAAVGTLLGPDGKRFCREKDNGKYMVDLPGVVLRRLEQLGVRGENMHWLGECTMCSPQRYWSHRATHGVRGSQANVIML